jgi:hypothetical protein
MDEDIACHSEFLQSRREEPAVKVPAESRFLAALE